MDLRRYSIVSRTFWMQIGDRGCQFGYVDHFWGAHTFIRQLLYDSVFLIQVWGILTRRQSHIWWSLIAKYFNLGHQDGFFSKFIQSWSSCSEDSPIFGCLVANDLGDTFFFYSDAVHNSEKVHRHWSQSGLPFRFVCRIQGPRFSFEFNLETKDGHERLLSEQNSWLNIACCCMRLNAVLCDCDHCATPMNTDFSVEMNSMI